MHRLRTASWLSLTLFVSVVNAAPAQQPLEGGWKASAAAVVITPAKPVWMAGYASRDKPAEGKAQDLYAKALALEDASGARLVIVTLDLIGVPRALREHVVRRAQEKYRLPPPALLLNASHTHCGPVLRVGPSVTYDLTDEQAKELDTYFTGLKEKLVVLVGKALDRLSPARLSYSHARAGFAMNRRLPTEKGYQNSPYPDGPVDHDVPVLRVEGTDGKLWAVLFGYACHNTTLSFNRFCGDYAGFAQQYLEEAHPGMTALFLAGCGGDQNPYPRGKLEQARQHGQTLANAVEAALLPKPQPIRGSLRTALTEVTLDFVPPATRNQLLELRESRDRYAKRKATLLLEELEKNGRIRSTYSYPVQVVRFGDDLTLVALAGETVVDYSLRLKRELTGTPLWVTGYSNDVFGYVPSLRVLKEGGYEAGDAFRYSSLAGPFTPTVEERIIDTVHKLARQVGAK